MALNSELLNLRLETYSPLPTLGVGLTKTNFDNNTINIRKDFQQLQQSNYLPAYNAGTTYNNDPTDHTVPTYAMYNSKFWTWVNPVPGSGVTPTEGVNWIEGFPSVMSHEPNKDVSLVAISKTHAEALVLYNAGALIKGATYELTDKRISIFASDVNKFCIQGCRSMRVVKNTYYTSSGINLGVWNSTLTPSALDVVVHGGRIWINVTGSIGSAIDDANLSADWSLEPTINDNYYQTSLFTVLYNFPIDTVNEQRDIRGNIVRGNIDITDWGNDSIYANFSKSGIYNNSNGAQIGFNSNLGSISNNTNTGNIVNNRNLGNIDVNSNAGVIVSNSNRGDVDNNSNLGTITVNSNSAGVSNNSNSGNININDNIGAITNNSNGSNIEFNTNSGAINSNANTGAIEFNTNNGGIFTIGAANANIRYNVNNGDISTTTTGDISDPIVNK